MSDLSPSGSVNRAAERRRTSRALRRMKGVRGSSYTKMIHAYWQSPQYSRLTPRAVKLLVDLTAQYRGKNNGDLTTAWSVMRAAGWTSKALLKKAQQELQSRGWIILTRQGSISAPTLWAVTFFAVDDVRDSEGRRKLDVAPCNPLNLWQLPDYDKPPEKSRRAFRKRSVQPDSRETLSREPGKVTDISTVRGQASGQKLFAIQWG